MTSKSQVERSPETREASLFRRAAVVLGLGGTAACAVAMILPIVGVVSSAASAGAQAAGGMAGMGAGGHVAHYSGLEGFLLRFGKEILIVSVVLVAGSFLARRVARRGYAAIGALVGGAILYYGMYEQSSVAVMYVTMAVGYTGWVGAYLWLRRCACISATPTSSRDATEQENKSEGRLTSITVAATSRTAGRIS